MSVQVDDFLQAYREGAFPMAEEASCLSFSFYKPFRRALLPIEGLHVPRRLQRTLRQGKYSVSVDRAFPAVIAACAAHRPEREKTWINAPIRETFEALHREGYAHSVEVWEDGGSLSGGLYGLALGGVFCGESMVSFSPNASKIALVHLCALLWRCGFSILDAQLINPHLVQFGVYDIPQEEYESRIVQEMKRPVSFEGPLLSPQLLKAFLERDLFLKNNSL